MNEPENIEEQLVDHFSATEGRSEPNDKSVQGWIHASKENRETYHTFKRIWRGSKLLGKSGKFDLLKGWQNVDRNIFVRQRRIRYLTNAVYALSGIAASVILLLSLNFFSPLFTNQNKPVIVSTNWGNRSEVVLPDGSLVNLNSGSQLTYHYNSFQKVREVKFSGEGFFDISKGRPFIIELPDGLELKVLGTKFNLRAYPEDKISKTALIEGTVELKTTGEKTLILSPGQIATFDKASDQLALVDEKPDHQLSWMENKLYMDNMSLGEVCTRMERWYAVQIKISDPIIAKGIHYTGVLSEETITDVLDALCGLSAIQYQMKGKQIIITKR